MMAHNCVNCLYNVFNTGSSDLYFLLSFIKNTIAYTIQMTCLYKGVYHNNVGVVVVV